MVDTIKAGDLVRLKSGGPVMTVDTVTTNGAICKWFKEGATRIPPSYTWAGAEPSVPVQKWGDYHSALFAVETLNKTTN